MSRTGSDFACSATHQPDPVFPVGRMASSASQPPTHPPFLSIIIMVMELRARAWHEHDMIFFYKKEGKNRKKRRRKKKI
jgi:hypothetical protein